MTRRITAMHPRSSQREVTYPEVSVVIPCYRAQQFVRAAMTSVKAQTFEAWELIVSDNASDDESYSIAEEIAATDSRIRVVRNDTNLGPVRNWLAAACLAKAPLVAFLFADDWYEPDFLAKTVPFMRDEALGFVYTAVRLNNDLTGAQTVAYQLKKSKHWKMHLRKTC